MLTKRLVVKVEFLVIDFGDLNDGFIVQVLLQAHNLAGHQLVCLVRIPAPIP